MDRKTVVRSVLLLVGYGILLVLFQHMVVDFYPSTCVGAFFYALLYAPVTIYSSIGDIAVAFFLLSKPHLLYGLYQISLAVSCLLPLVYIPFSTRVAGELSPEHYK